MICPARRWAAFLSAHQTSPVRRFFYRHIPDGGTARGYGVGHTFDVLLLFRSGPFSWWSEDSREIALGDAMRAYWTRFAASADPNDASAPFWPLYDHATDPYLLIDDPIAAGEAVRKPECDFWDSIR
jgi:carboxylesterase type B